jgi:iron complex transport system permease protein
LENRKFKSWLAIILSLILILLAAIVLSITIGEIKIPLKDIPSILKDGNESIEFTIIKKLRLPRLLLGISVGGALSLAGVILQGIYRNPLVEPYTMGISGGAALGVAIAIVFGLNQVIGSLMLPFLGFIGALFTVIIVYSLSIRRGKIRIQTMLLIGVMISFIASSIMMLLQSLSDANTMQGIIFWTMGSLDETNQTLIKFCFWSSILGLVLTYIFAQPLNALRLGEEKARHLGINTETAIRVLFVISSLLTGICVSVAGVIGFVGLIIPHLMRTIVGSDFRILLISSFLGGSTFLIICDTIARTIFQPHELPIGVITGIIGGSVFIVVLSRINLKSQIG